MGDKAWQLTGEVDASRRPLNSALEVDLDFETTGQRLGGARFAGEATRFLAGVWDSTQPRLAVAA